MSTTMATKHIQTLTITIEELETLIQPWLSLDFSTLPVERTAEAQRIAARMLAADDLLAVAEAALPLLHWADCHGSRCPEAIAQLRAAIAKAKEEA